jgi:hypothetical protein
LKELASEIFEPSVGDLISVSPGTWLVVIDDKEKVHAVEAIAMATDLDDSRIAYLGANCFPKWLADAQVMAVTTELESGELAECQRIMDRLREERKARRPIGLWDEDEEEWDEDE